MEGVCLTRIGVKVREIRNLYVLEVFRPGSRRRLAERRVARRPWLPPERGEIIRAGRTKLRVTSVGARVDRRVDRIEHVLEIYTLAVARNKRARPE
jgi:sorbitol-specific phosphotransferase system component IIA